MRTFGLLLVLGALTAAPLAAGDIFVEDSINEDYVQSNDSSNRFAARFEATASGLAEELIIRGRRTVTHTHLFSLALHADGGTEASPAPGAMLAGDTGVMGSSAVWSAVTIDPVELEAGETYWVVFYTVDDDTIQWYRSLNDSEQASRTMASTDGGQTWAHNSTAQQSLIVRSLPVTAVADSYLVLQGDSIDMPAPGLLMNDLYEGYGVMQAVLDAGPANGTLVLNADGSFVYAPNAGFSGTDSFTYRAAIGSNQSESATVTLDVQAVNQAPSAGEVTYGMLEGEVLNVQAPGLLAYASDPENDELQAVLVSATDNGIIVLQADGSFSYTPVDGFIGQDFFIYRVNDGELDSAETKVNLEVHRRIVLPVAEDREFDVLEDAVLAVTAADGLLNNGTDFDLVQLVISEQPSHGTLETKPDGAFVYAPAPDFNGNDQFSYQVVNADGDATEGTVTIHVAPVNDAPTFVVGPNVVVYENAGFVMANSWATEISAGAANEADQTIAFDVQLMEGDYLFDNMPQVDTDGNLSFTVAPGAWGTALLHIMLLDYSGTENGGADTSEVATFEITVNPEVAAPSFVAGGGVVALEDAGSIVVEGWATGMKLSEHSRANGMAFIATVLHNAEIFAELPTVDADSGTLAFRAADDAFGYADISLVLMEEGGDAKQSPHQSFRINILAVNDAPTFVAGPHVYAESADGAVEIEAWATQISAGAANEAGQELAFSIEITQGQELFDAAPTIDAEGTLSFVPAFGAKGTAIVQITLTDDGGTENGGNDSSQSILLQVELHADSTATSGGAARAASSSQVTGCAGSNSSPWMPALALLALLAAVAGARRRTA